MLNVLKSYMQTYLEEQKASRLPSGIADKKKQLKIYGRSVKKLEELQQDNHLLDTNVLEGYRQREELTREMVECFIDCIYVYEDYIQINWKFEVDASYIEKEMFF